MRRPVFWSRSALDDIKEQIAFIARDNPAVARPIAERFRDAGAALGETATGRGPGTFEKSLVRLPYIVAYALEPVTGRDSVVIHTARRWRAGAWPT
ncbi:type II toxin-antitoxin system RelE/ParE family toxin [Methylobacterium brachiatum]|uniref:type II toxin-antitoxin system RelE/ParE family toxin n=1 Tax=Methylobacterium brachiatum TaxID=269660 RepID=UPI002448E362|nr:type II toxin-antitoxin system RelE/ParE family toxin [Methylobacterium brachiatum]MDH2312629.1 type II toxin-antitoxin system RelE/ParE family toxin [Methylobacterium brachiatum]